jgi:hypothetical protein
VVEQLVGSLVQTNGWQRSFHLSMNRPIAAIRAVA